MTTAILQFLVQGLTLGFAGLALAVTRCRGRVPPVHRAAWCIVAVFFLWRGVSGVTQSTAAFVALIAGKGSAPYELFLVWGPAMNYTRTLIAVVTGWALAALPLLRDQSMARLGAGLNIACFMLAGAGAYGGWREGAVSLRHITSLTVLGAVELIGVLIALLVGLFAYTLDRYLWIGLCLYAVQVALDVVWYSATAGFFFPGGWFPPQPVRYIYSSVILLVACGLAWHRLVLARRGVRITEFMEVVGDGMITASRLQRGGKGRSIVDG